MFVEPTLLSPEWQLVDGSVRVQTSRPTVFWVSPISTNALGLYRKKTEVTTHRIRRAEIESLPGSLQDPLRALQDLPGVARSPMNAGWLLVRGMEPEDSQIDWQGLPLSQLFHLGGIASIFHPQTISEVRYRPTGWVNRRSSLGGSVSVVAEAPADETRLELGTDIINSALFVTRPLSDTQGLTATARRSWLRQAIAFTQGREASAIAPQFTDWSVGLQGPDSSVLLVGLNDSIDAPTADGEQILQVDLDSQMLMGHHRWKDGQGKRLLSALISRESRSLSEEEEALSLHVSTVAHLHAESTHQQDSAEFQFGADLSAGSHSIHYPPQTIRRGHSRAEFFSSVSLGKKRRLLLGLRNTHLAVEQQSLRFGLDPAIRVIEPVWGDLAFQLHLARRHQAPTMVQLIGDPEGPICRSSVPMRALRASSGSPNHSTPQSRPLPSRSAISRFEKTTARWDNSQEWPMAQSPLCTGPRPLSVSCRRQCVAEPPTRDKNRSTGASFSRPGTAQFSVLTGWRNERGWQLSGRFRYASGLPYLEERPTAFDLLTQQEILLKPTLNPTTNRLPDPYALDLKLSRRTTFKRWRLEAYLDLQNLTNRRVPEPILTGFEEIPVFGFSLPFLPVFGVEGVFWPQGR